MRALGLCVVLAASTAAHAQAAPLIEKAEKELQNLEYGNATRLLETALKMPGNDRATVLKIFELEAIAFATTGQQAKCAKAFHALLSLAPDFKLVGNYPPRVSTAYYEALGWLDSNRPIEARQLEPLIAGGKVTTVRVEVVSDPLKLVKEVRFHVVANGKQVEVDVPASKGVMTAPANALRIEWWAELLGEKKAVLVQLGTVDSPRSDNAPGAPAAVVAAPPPPVIAPPPPLPLVLNPKPAVSKAGSVLTGTRPASLGVMGVAVASAAAGIFFAVSSTATTAKFNSAATDSEGRVTGLTRKEAVALDAQQRLHATLANVFIVTGIALAAGGVALFVVGAEGSKVALVPSGAGAALVGSFP